MRKTLEWIDQADPFQLLVLIFIAAVVFAVGLEIIKDAVKDK